MALFPVILLNERKSNGIGEKRSQNPFIRFEREVCYCLGLTLSDKVKTMWRQGKGNVQCLRVN